MTDEQASPRNQAYHVQAHTVGAIGPNAHGEVVVNQYFSPPAAPAPANRPSRDWLPLQPNPLFQERPGEFEALEQLLFGQNSSGRVGLVGVGVVGMRAWERRISRWKWLNGTKIASLMDTSG